IAPRLRTSGTTVCPAAVRRATSAVPINPDAPVTATLSGSMWSRRKEQLALRLTVVKVVVRRRRLVELEGAIDERLDLSVAIQLDHRGDLRLQEIEAGGQGPPVPHWRP